MASSDKEERQKFLNLLLALFLLGTSFYFGYFNQPKEMSLIIVSSFIAGAFINLHNLRHFRIGNIEADLRDALNEAHATKEELQELSEKLQKESEELREEIKIAKAMSVI